MSLYAHCFLAFTFVLRAALPLTEFNGYFLCGAAVAVVVFKLQ